MLGGISICGSGGRASALSRIPPSLTSSPAFGLEVPRPVDSAHEFCVTLLAFRQPVNRARCHRTFRSSNHELSCSWHDAYKHSDCFFCDCSWASSTRPSLQTVTSCCLVFVLDSLICCRTVMNHLVFRDDYSCVHHEQRKQHVLLVQHCFGLPFDTYFSRTYHSFCFPYCVLC